MLFSYTLTQSELASPTTPPTPLLFSVTLFLSTSLPDITHLSLLPPSYSLPPPLFHLCQLPPPPTDHVVSPVNKNHLKRFRLNKVEGGVGALLYFFSLSFAFFIIITFPYYYALLSPHTYSPHSLTSMSFQTSFETFMRL